MFFVHILASFDLVLVSLTLAAPLFPIFGKLFSQNVFPQIMPSCVCHAFLSHVSFKIIQNEHVQNARGLPSPGRKGVARLWPQNGRQVGEIVEIYENSFKNFIFELPGVARVSVALIQTREAQYFFSGLTVSIR